VILVMLPLHSAQSWFTGCSLHSSTTTSIKNALITQHIRGYKQPNRADIKKIPAVYQIHKIHCKVREVWGVLASKETRKRGWVPSSVRGKSLPPMDIMIELPRLEGLLCKGVMTNGCKVLLLIHNKHDKLVETTVSEVRDIRTHPFTDLPHEMWFNRTADPVDMAFEMIPGQMLSIDPGYEPGLVIPQEELKWMPGLEPKDHYLDAIYEEGMSRQAAKRARRAAAIEAAAAAGESVEDMEAEDEGEEGEGGGEE